jgi:hypothetical protein
MQGTTLLRRYSYEGLPHTPLHPDETPGRLPKRTQGAHRPTKELSYRPQGRYKPRNLQDSDEQKHSKHIETDFQVSLQEEEKDIDVNL